MNTSEEEIGSTAVHEAGHAFINAMLGIEIVRASVGYLPDAQGGTLGRVTFRASNDRDSDMLRFVTLIAGAVAEKVILNRTATGAGTDAMRCAEISKRYLEVGLTDEDAFIRRMNFAAKVATTMIVEHADKVMHIAKLLSQRGSLNGNEIKEIVRPVAPWRNG